MKTYKVICKESGDIIEENIKTKEAAKELIESYEKFDKNERSYIKDFYEIIEFKL